MFQELFSLYEPGLVFEMFTNMASFLALLILFHKDVIKLVKGFTLYIFSKEKEAYKRLLYVIKLIIAVYTDWYLWTFI